MKLEVVKCDGCNAELVGVENIYHPVMLRTDRFYASGSGNGTTDYNWVMWDLCEQCAKRLVRRMLNLSDAELKKLTGKHPVETKKGKR